MLEETQEDLEANLLGLGLVLDSSKPLGELKEGVAESAVSAHSDAGVLGDVSVIYLPAMTAPLVDRFRVGHHDRRQLFVIGHRVGTKSSDVLRSAGVFFMDRAGNALSGTRAWPQLISGPIRRVAEASGVSVGLAQEALEILQTAGYISEAPHRRLLQNEELIDRWAAAYPFGLGSRAKDRTFRGHVELLEPTSEVYLSGKAAIEELTAETMLLYVDA